MPTIYVPTVLRLYREIAPEMAFFVIGDVQAPDDEIRAFLKTVEPARYYSAEDQRKLGYACCDLIAWRHPGRRSIGLLEAVKAGADIVVHADDDNTAIEHSYFQHFERLFGSRFTGLKATSGTGWVDAAWFLQPSVHHRGFPHQLWHPFSPPEIGSVRDARIGVAAGLWLGDPDIDAVTRIVSRPACMTMSPVADAGFVVDPKCYSRSTPKNTAFARDLLPAMAMLTPYGRFDDIWCSFIAERVMREYGYAVALRQALGLAAAGRWPRQAPDEGSLRRGLRDDAYAAIHGDPRRDGTDGDIDRGGRGADSRAPRQDRIFQGGRPRCRLGARRRARAPLRLRREHARGGTSSHGPASERISSR